MGITGRQYTFGKRKWPLYHEFYKKIVTRKSRRAYFPIYSSETLIVWFECPKIAM